MTLADGVLQTSRANASKYMYLFDSITLRRSRHQRHGDQPDEAERHLRSMYGGVIRLAPNKLVAVLGRGIIQTCHFLPMSSCPSPFFILSQICESNVAISNGNGTASH